MRDVFILGDSHARAIRLAFKAGGWTVHGGMLSPGRVFDEPFFEQDGDTILFHDAEAQKQYARALASAGASTIADIGMPIVSTFGFNSNRLARMLCGESGEPPRLSSAVINAIVTSVKRPVLDFYRLLPPGQTFAVRSPQRISPRRIGMSRKIEDILSSDLAAIGVGIVDVIAQTVDEAGMLREEFWKPEDRSHANEAYGAIVVQRIAEMLAAASSC